MTTTEADLVGALMALRQVLGEHCRRVTAGEPVRWAGIGDLLDLGAQHCYERAEVEVSRSGPACR